MVALMNPIRPLLRIPKKIRFACLGLFLAVCGWAAWDLWWPRHADMRAFDADEVARLDTAMWRSYYARERLTLFLQLGELLRKQYRLPFLRSQVTAYHAARAAFVFKDGKQRADYEKALPDLVLFYSDLRKVGNIDFDVNRAAKLELEWWIVHRERKTHPPRDLDRALAATAGEIYQQPADAFGEHARLRAQAMLIRDEKAESGGVSEEDWKEIDRLLHESWRSLGRAVK